MNCRLLAAPPECKSHDGRPSPQDPSPRSRGRDSEPAHRHPRASCDSAASRTRAPVCTCRSPSHDVFARGPPDRDRSRAGRRRCSPALSARVQAFYSYVCDSARFSPRSSDSASAGYCFDLGNRARPTAAAIGARPAFPFVEPTENLEIDWTRGVDLIGGSDIWVPAELVWCSYPHYVARTGPVISPVAQAGLAAGPTTEFAIRNALREIVERDAMTLSWTGRRGVRIVTGMPEALLRLGNHDALSTRWLSFESDFGIPVLGALACDRLTGYSTMGTACHEDAQTELCGGLPIGLCRRHGLRVSLAAPP
ncbi:YcaO-like family protein [Rhodococcus sp. IEGM 1409]|uniref:YcaO-like family protein n=1 Tax=Rhodococcus sp. IEGM 1409 TaxID=3047082 RepID=UPI0024B81D1B|nr:YcaO-like family protein [Rhodococcus sp. IEGM 1409]MDI9902069.1 YcaO-like family protein [Rhodococcus sp. IEGM 1409]